MYVFHFLQTVSIVLEETFKGHFVCGGCFVFVFFFLRKKSVALAKLTLVAEERFPFFNQLFVIKLLLSYIFIIKGEENLGFLNHFDLN